MPRNTHINQVMQWLKAGHSITSKEAIDKFGCTRLSAVIFRLRNDYGLDISDQTIQVKNRNGRNVYVARYELTKQS
jgi:hypothetical protein